jgi:hypothetical protein
MAGAKQNTAKRRAEDRAKRRADAQSRPSRSAQQDGAGRSGDHDMTDALRGAASAAIAGAAVGAARAYAQRRSRSDPEPEPEMERDEQPEPGRDDQPEPETEREEQPEPEMEREEQPEREQQPPRDTRPLQPPLSGGQAREIIQRAREELQELRGVEPEAVSSVTRTADGWRVGLQVVELHRIPESTDVLATYEVELDPDGRLVTFERTHRYVRSEAERG